MGSTSYMKLWPVIFIYQKYQGNNHLSLNKDYMYLKYRLQWFPLETKNILHLIIFDSHTFRFCGNTRDASDGGRSTVQNMTELLVLLCTWELPRKEFPRDHQILAGDYPFTTTFAPLNPDISILLELTCVWPTEISDCQVCRALRWQF